MTNTNTIIFRGYPRLSRLQARRMSRNKNKNRRAVSDQGQQRRLKALTMSRISSAPKHVNRLNSLPQESQNGGKEEYEDSERLNESEELDDSEELRRDASCENPGTDFSLTGSFPEKSKPLSEKQKRAAHTKEILAGTFNDAMNAAHDQHVADIAKRGADDEFRTPLFKFIWTVRGHRDLTRHLADPAKAFNLVSAHLTDWTLYAKQHKQKPTYGFTGDVWRDWFNIPTDDARLEFSDVWELSRFRAGESPLESAIVAAREMRLLPSDAVKKKRAMVINLKSEKDYTFLLSIAGQLQVAVGEGDIMLPLETLGKLLGLSPMSVSRLIRMLVDDGYLTRTTKWRLGKAQRYHLDATRWERLKEKAEKLGVEIS